MSFAFSVGDFIAVGAFIADIVSSLKDSTGSKSDYQELIRGLDALDRALKTLDRLQPIASSPGTVDSIKCAALSCRVPLEQFLNKIKKYEVTLGSHASTTSISLSSKALLEKITWLSKDEDIDRLRKYLDVHLGTINILLLEHGLQTFDVSFRALQEQCSDIQASLRGIDTAVKIHSHNCPKSDRLNSGHSPSPDLVVLDDKRRDSIRIFEAVVQLQASVSAIGIDTRWTYFQAPVKVEDALGRVFPVPSEYSISELHAILRCRFRKGPGSKHVKHGDFRLTDRRNKTMVDGASMRDLLTGLDIIMSIMIDVVLGENTSVCPITECSSENTIPAPWGGGRTCIDCRRWFDTSDKSIQPSRGKRHVEEVDPDDSERSDDGHEES